MSEYCNKCESLFSKLAGRELSKYCAKHKCSLSILNGTPAKCKACSEETNLDLTKVVAAALYTGFVCSPYPHRRDCDKCGGLKACEIIKKAGVKPHEARAEALAKLKAFIEKVEE